MANKIQLRRGTKALLNSLGPLALGEPGYITDTRELVIGNGTGANTPVVTATSADITYYVRTDGNDGNTGLANTAAGAFKTIQKAVNSIPYHVDHSVSVNVQPGTYPEDVKIFDFNGSTEIYINGGSTLAAASGYFVNSFTVYGCTNQIVIQGFTASTTTRQAFHFANSNFCQLWYSRSVASASIYGVSATNNATVRVADCEMSNKEAAIGAAQGATIVSSSNKGAGNNYALFASEGGTITKDSGQPSGNSYEYASNRGIITSGVLNPWGDNTGAQRTTVVAFRTAAVAVPSNIATKFLFQGLSMDNLGEFSNGSRFTAKNTGMYAIDINLGFNGIPDQGYVDVLLYLNGVEVTASRTGVSGTSSGINAQLHDIFYLVAGQYLEVYMFGSSAFTAEGYATRNTFKIQRIS